MAGALPATIRTNDFWGETFRAEYEQRAQQDITTAMAQAAPDDIDPEVARNAGPVRADIFKGTRQRRVLDPGLGSIDLEVAAGKAALKSAGLGPQDIDLFLYYAVLPDEIIPLPHAKVASTLGLRRDVVALSVAAGCGSWPIQLHTAAHLLAGTKKHALLIQSTIMSRVQDYDSPSSVNGGDGAMATALGPVEQDRGYIAYKQHTKGELAAGVRAMCKDAPQVPWYASDQHKSPLRIYGADAQAARIMGGRAASFCRETCSALLDEAGYTPDDVDWFVVSQPTVWFGQACCEAMGISPDKTAHTFEDYAHIMAASAPMNLMEAHRGRKLHDDDLVMVYSPGAGFVQNALLLRWQGCETGLVEVGS
jgi:3-oxoacyl-[acyl-carrier-protein] synthase-3